MDATQVPLDDGEYSIMILDAEDDPSGEQDDAYMLDVTILDGGHKGEVLSLAAAGLGLDPLDLLGMPGTLTVAQGVPSVVIEN